MTKWENYKLFIKVGATNKKPTERWSILEFRYDYTTLRELDIQHYAFLPPAPYVVIDTDRAEDTEFMLNKLLPALNIKPIYWHTSTSAKAHFLFKVNPTMISEIHGYKTPTSLKGSDVSLLGLIKTDYKGFAKGYVRISGRVKPEVIINAMDNDLVPTLPISLLPISNKKLGLNLMNFPAGERHDILYKQWIVKLRQGFSKNEKKINELLNEIMIIHGLSTTQDYRPDDIALQVHSSFEAGEITTLSERGKYAGFLLYNELGVGSSIKDYSGLYKALSDTLKLVRDVATGQVWGINWRQEHTVMNENMLTETIMRELMTTTENVKPSLAREIANSIINVINLVELNDNELEIKFQNGIYNIVTGEFTPKQIEFWPNLIKHDYIPPHRIPETNKNWVLDLLGEWALEDEDVITELLELIGIAISKYRKLERFWLLEGTGANGKSAFLKWLIEILGKDNVSAVELKALTDGTFDSAQLYGMQANIVTDLSAMTITDTANLKKITSCEPIMAQNKNEPIFKFTPTALLIMAVNQWPQMRESGSSDAIDRRAKAISFRNKFTFSKQYVTKEKFMLLTETCSVLISLALEAIKTMFNRAGEHSPIALTESASAIALYDKNRLESNSVYEYWAGRDLLVDGDKVGHHYNVYKTGCEENKYTPYNKTNFVKFTIKCYRQNHKLSIKTYYVDNVATGKREELFGYAI